MDVDKVNLVKGKGNKGKGKGKEKSETGKCQGDGRRCFYFDGKGHIKSNDPQMVIDDKKKSDSKSSSSTDNVMPVTRGPDSSGAPVE